MFSRFLARQLRKPTGLFGKYIITRALNKANKVMNDMVLHLLQVQPNDRIMEIGFGGGDLLTRMVKEVGDGLVTGVDFSSDIVEAGQSRFQQQIEAGKLKILCDDVNSLSFEANSFNKICTVNTIYFWPDVERGLNEISRVLDSKGLLFICFSIKETMDKIEKITRHGFNKYTVDEVKVFMEKAGFINIRIVPGKNNHGEFVCAVGEKF